MQKAVACSPACVFPLHRGSFVLYVRVIYLADYLTFWRMRHKMFRLACPVSKNMFPKELGTAREEYAPEASCMGPSTEAAQAPPWLQTAFLLPFCLAALCIPCSAAVSAVPLFLEGMKAFHKTVSDFQNILSRKGPTGIKSKP